ncbi:MAG: S8 family serine peptidase [bacterium]
MDSLPHFSQAGTLWVGKSELIKVVLDKPTRSPAQRKIEGSILSLIEHGGPNGILSTNTYSPGSVKTRAKVDNAGRVYVNLYLATGPAGLTPDVCASKLQHLTTPAYPVALDPYSPIVPVWLSLSQISEVAGWAGIKQIRLVTNPFKNEGPILSEGVPRLKSDFVSSIWPLATGEGVKVGVMSNDCGSSENMISSRQANHELPMNLEILRDNLDVGVVPATRTHEGLAMMEIVHDVAPRASLAFTTAGATVTEFCRNMRELATPPHNCKVIVDDYTFFDEPFFEDGPISGVISDLTGNNVVCVTSAGNWGQDVCSFTYNPISLSLSLNGSLINVNAQNFYNGDAVNTIHLPPGATLSAVLQWDDPFYAPTHDYDIYVVDQQRNVILPETSTNDPFSGTAMEFIEYQNVSSSEMDVGIVVVGASASPNAQNLKLVARCSFRYNHLAYTQRAGSVLGHAASAYAITCGSIGAQTATYSEVDPLSSCGPVTPIFSRVSNPFVGASTSIPQTRHKPDLCSFDGISTSVPTFSIFYGTSASAPHVAGVAALLLSQFPATDPITIAGIFKRGSIDFGNSDTHELYGAGRLDAFRSLAMMTGLARASFSTERDSRTAHAGSIVSKIHIGSTGIIGKMYVGVTLQGHSGMGRCKIVLTSPAPASKRCS